LAASQHVITGLAPVIHLLQKTFCEEVAGTSNPFIGRVISVTLRRGVSITASISAPSGKCHGRNFNVRHCEKRATGL
jgi:hypothetical protein